MPITKASGQAVAVAAKGDLVVGSATNDAAVLGVGSADQVLTVDSSTTTGLKWATASAGGMTLISTTTLSGASTTISSIPTTYTNLLLIFRDQTSGNNTNFRMRVNGDTGQNYKNYTASGLGTAYTYFDVGVDYSTGTNYEYGSGQIFFPDYANTTGWKLWHSFCVHTKEGDDSNTQFDLAYGCYRGGESTGNTSAITSITFFPNTGTGLGGTVLLYGEK